MNLNYENAEVSDEVLALFNKIKDQNRSVDKTILRDQKIAKELLLYAVEHGDNSVVDFILKSDVKITYSRRDQNPVVLAARKDYKNILELLINKETINDFDGTGYTPLTAACAEGHYEIILFLLAHGADINCLDGVFLIFFVFHIIFFNL